MVTMVLWNHVTQEMCLFSGNTREDFRVWNWEFSSILQKSTTIKSSAVLRLHLSPFFRFAVERLRFLRSALFVFWKCCINRYFPASEGKPCSQSCGSPEALLQPPDHSSRKGSSSSQSSPSIPEDVFFDNTCDQVHVHDSILSICFGRVR